MQLRLHDKYLFRSFARVFCYSVLSFTVVYVVVNVFEEIDNFIDHEATVREIAVFYVYSTPFILTYIVPVSLLLATLFSMGVMARRNELTALLSSGISLIRVAAPIFVASLVVSIGSVVCNDVVVTKASRKRDEVKLHQIENRPRVDPDVRENFHYLGEDGRMFLADTYRHRTQTLYDVVLQEYQGSTLIRRVDARKAIWKNNQWVFLQGTSRSFHEESESLSTFTELAEPDISETPEDFARREVDEENMNYLELSQYIEKLRRSGGQVEKYLVDLHFKLSFPFAGSIFVLIGVAFASGKRKQSVATGFGVTLSVSFLYYTVLRVGQTLGHNGVLPPFLAAQAGNIIFLAVGLLLVAKANR